MARAWTRLLGTNFMLGVGSADASLADVNHLVMGEGVRSYKLAWEYLSYAKRNAFTHVYCREEKMLLFMIFLNTFLFRIPLRFCYELHHLVYMDIWWHHLLLKKADQVVSITKGMVLELTNRGYPSARILVAPDAADISLFTISISKQEARSKLDLPLDKKIIIYTGAINEPWKGVETLYEAAKQFDESYLFLIIGGKPHYVDYFRAHFPDLPNFILLGHKPHADIPLYLKAANVAVLPNSSKNEISRVSTSPMKLFEYMAAGIPIVASDLSSIREILDEHKAILVAPDDCAALAEGIKKLAGNTEMAQTLAVRAREAASVYTWDTRAKSILDFIKHA
jgi:glycosyltransferase involved in cell wall biosynthesis